MLPTQVDNSLVIATSMALMPCGHPEALPEVQRQMRLINQAYADPAVLRCTDEVVRYAAALHGPPGDDSESERRHRMRTALERLRACLEGLPHPSPRPVRVR
jgi:hypothetical protein